jgi:hypothetical protein
LDLGPAVADFFELALVTVGPDVSRSLKNFTAVLESVRNISPSKPKPRRLIKCRLYFDSKADLMESDTLPIISEKRERFQGYSASVKIEFFVDGKLYLPSQTGSDVLIFREAPELTDSIGELGRLVVSVDGVPHYSTLKILPHEASSNQIPVERQTNSKRDHDGGGNSNNSF